MSPGGLVVHESPYGPDETVDRLIAAISHGGMALIARVNHAAAAATVHLDLRPTEVLIFGNPRGGTPLMQASQTSGIDLPLKALVWQDACGRTWLGYNDPHWTAKRHGVDDENATGQMVAALAAIAAAVTGV